MCEWKMELYLSQAVWKPNSKFCKEVKQDPWSTIFLFLFEYVLFQHSQHNQSKEAWLNNFFVINENIGLCVINIYSTGWFSNSAANWETGSIMHNLSFSPNIMQNSKDYHLFLQSCLITLSKMLQYTDRKTLHKILHWQNKHFRQL